MRLILVALEQELLRENARHLLSWIILETPAAKWNLLWNFVKHILCILKSHITSLRERLISPGSQLSWLQSTRPQALLRVVSLTCQVLSWSQKTKTKNLLHNLGKFLSVFSFSYSQFCGVLGDVLRHRGHLAFLTDKYPPVWAPTDGMLASCGSPQEKQQAEEKERHAVSTWSSPSATERKLPNVLGWTSHYHSFHLKTRPEGQWWVIW